jgi:hypothetical protein
MAPAQTDPNAAFESSSQPPSSGCCDDHLSPLSVPDWFESLDRLLAVGQPSMASMTDALDQRQQQLDGANAASEAATARSEHALQATTHDVELYNERDKLMFCIRVRIDTERLHGQYPVKSTS